MPLSAAGNAELDLTAIHVRAADAARIASVDVGGLRTEFRLLGPLEVVHRGVPLAAGGHKRRALLARLLLEANRTVSVQRLVDALWGDEVPPTAVKMVQIYVSQLRKLLPGALHTRPPGYLLEVAPEAVDLHRFGRLRAEARAALAGRDPARGADLLRAALALWRGPALAEFPEPFAVAEAAHLEELRLAAVEERVDADLALGRHADIVGELRALATSHPLRQRLRAQLMLALYRAGRHAEALDAFQDFRRRIRDELGLEPPAALGELQYRILQQDPGLDLATSGGSPASLAPAVQGGPRTGPAAVRGDPDVLVGRAAELARLERALDAAAAGRGSTALLGGPAGIGKTRLAGELAERARRRGAPVLTGRCIDLVGAAVPYLPLVEALRPLRGSPVVAGLDELARLLPGTGAGPRVAPPDRSAGLSRLHLFEEVLELLDRLGAGGPVVLVVEDLHWADASTLDLLAYLTHAARERRLLLLATARCDTVPHDDPLQRLAAELARAGLADRMELGPLDRPEVEELVARRSAGPLAPEVSDDVCARSQGNPFYAQELLAAALRGEDALPGRLRDVLLADVGRLDARTRSVVRVAAAAGRAVSHGLLTAASGLSEPALLDALREAVAHGILIADPTRRTYRFRHALIAEAAYSSLLPFEREDVHGQLALALAERPSLAAPGAGAGELAEHWIAAGRPVEALAASLRAAREAQAVSGLAEALRHLERVLDLWEQVPDAEEVGGLARPGLLAWAGDLVAALEARGDASAPAALGVAEARELYPLAVVLESLAIRQSPPLAPAVLEALREANARLRAARDPAAAAVADDVFHARLTAGCGDAPLLAVLRPVKRALLRYEHVYMREPARVLRSADQHDRIVDALARGDHPAAAQRLRHNLTGGLPDLTPALER